MNKMKEHALIEFCLETHTRASFWNKLTRDLAKHWFLDIFDFAGCGGVVWRFAYGRGLFVGISPHFLQNYCWAPEIGLPADIVCHFRSFYSEVPLCTWNWVSADMFIDMIIIHIYTVMLIDVHIDILIDVYDVMCTYMFIYMIMTLY